MIRWIPLEQLPRRTFPPIDPGVSRVQGWIRRTGMCPAVVVRTLPGDKYEVIEGHRRLEGLVRLGHTHARCDVWELSDEDAECFKELNP